MQDLKCPYCQADMPHGTKACDGCQASIEYGAPREALLFVYITALCVGLYEGSSVHLVAGFIAFFLVMVGGPHACHVYYRNRVFFDRNHGIGW